MTTIEHQTEAARQRSIAFPGLVIWLYQYGANTFGLRLGALRPSEYGVLVAVYHRGASVTPQQAKQMARRTEEQGQ